MSEHNDNSCESMGSDVLLQPSRLASGGGTGASNIGLNNPLLRTGVLRPSLLGPSRLSKAVSNNSTNFSTTAATAAAIATTQSTCENDSVEAEKVKGDIKVNPFLKDQDDNDEDETTEVAKLPATANKNKDEDNSNANDNLTDPMSMLRKNGFERANLFAATKSSIPLVEKSGFIFGQNVHERVVGENVKPESSGKTESNDHIGSDSGQLLFSSVIQNAAVKPAGENNDTSFKKDSIETKSLTDVAREYEESRARKRTFEEVETFTGEENEVNIIDINCKLFAFVKSNWEERGRGSLRLNDSKNEQECSRLVFRTSGNLRVLLNTKVWGDMDAARPSPKSLRLTAMDNTGIIKIFLVMARPTEISQLFSALKERIDKWKLLPPEETGNISDDTDTTNDDSKNGITKCEVEEAATAAEPEQDDSNEPSPKKSAAQDNDEDADEASINDNSNNN